MVDRVEKMCAQQYGQGQYGPPPQGTYSYGPAQTGPQAPGAQVPPPGANPMWYQNFYRIRKKVLTIGNKYWIEDASGRVIGFSKQKILRLKEDIRVYTDETMRYELFRIKQRQVVDLWGTFDIVDSQTNMLLGSVQRQALKSTFAWDEWTVLDAYGRPIGKIEEKAGLGLARKYVPGGALIPEKMTLKDLYGNPIADINQKFKIIGDIWELRCYSIPPYLDRRTLLGCLLLMGMIERQHK